jgi:dolichyl-phosphate beta-glucosyltransferase
VTISTSIIIPAFNEAKRLAAGYERFRPVLESMGVEETAIIVIDDGSTDDTMRVAHDVYGHLPHTLFVRQPVNTGKGAAVRLGISLARGQYVIATDADMSIRPQHFPEIVAALEHSPLVPGTRVHEGHIDYDSTLRTIAGNVFNRVVRHYTGTTLRDTQCGCKGFQIGPARILALLGFYDRFIYDAEMLYLADQLNLEVTPLNVTWDDITGSSVRVGRDALQMIRDLRSFRRMHYENPVVKLGRHVDVPAVASVARDTRVQGLALARGTLDTLLVLPRDGAVAATSIAAALGGTMGTASIDELRGRSFTAV